MAIAVLRMTAGSRAIVVHERVDHYFQGIERVAAERREGGLVGPAYVHGCTWRDVKNSRSKIDFSVALQ